MMIKQAKDFKKPFLIDIPLLIGLVLLMLISSAVLYSTSGEALVEAQTYRFLGAFLIMIIITLIPKNLIIFFAPFFYGFSLLLLVLVQLKGIEVNGSKRWLDVGIRIQPSEMTKLAIPLMLAYLFRDKPLKPKPWDILVSLIVIIIPCSFIFKQPDLGTAILVASSGIAFLYFAGISWKIIGAFLLLIVISAPTFWVYGMKPYQKDRVMALINPESDPLGKGYHIIQSKIAIGSGGYDGKGWMKGTQSKLEFLPEQTTDFIFAVYAEEFGFTGILWLFLLYFLILLRAFYLTLRMQDNFARLLSSSVVFGFFIYFFVNVGMVMGVFPVVGLPLPLISYGGTSILTILIAFGIVMNMNINSYLPPKRGF